MKWKNCPPKTKIPQDGRGYRNPPKTKCGRFLRPSRWGSMINPHEGALDFTKLLTNATQDSKLNPQEYTPQESNHKNPTSKP